MVKQTFMEELCSFIQTDADLCVNEERNNRWWSLVDFLRLTGFDWTGDI